MAVKKNSPKTKIKKIPSPLFDTLSLLKEQYKTFQSQPDGIAAWLSKCEATPSPAMCKDYQLILHFLYSYRGSPDTFNAYRRELERLTQWSWLVAERSVLQLKRPDIEAFIEFCQNPPDTWIATKTVSRFIESQGERLPNPAWRPFNVKISKKTV